MDRKFYNMKVCSNCNLEKPFIEFHRNKTRPDGYHNQCKICRKSETKSQSAIAYRKQYWKDNKERNSAAVKKWYLDNPEKLLEHKLKVTYHVTLDWYYSTLELQQYNCAICHSSEPGGTGRWHVDHNHMCCPSGKSCGKCVRGLLCARCNVGIAMFRDSIVHLKGAINYLESNAISA